MPTPRGGWTRRSVVAEDGAFVLHDVTLENITIGNDRLVPDGAVITTQVQADALN